MAAGRLWIECWGKVEQFEGKWSIVMTELLFLSPSAAGGTPLCGNRYLSTLAGRIDLTDELWFKWFWIDPQKFFFFLIINNNYSCYWNGYIQNKTLQWCAMQGKLHSKIYTIKWCAALRFVLKLNHDWWRMNHSQTIPRRVYTSMWYVYLCS